MKKNGEHSGRLAFLAHEDQCSPILRLPMVDQKLTMVTKAGRRK